MILVLTAITALISLGGIVAQMAAAKTLKGHDEWQHGAFRSHGHTVVDLYAHDVRDPLCNE